jgi:hypothetical protein
MTASIIQICGFWKNVTQESRSAANAALKPCSCSAEGAPGGSTRQCHRPNAPITSAVPLITIIQQCTHDRPMRLCSQPVNDTSRPEAMTAPRFQHMPCRPE